MCFCDHYWVEVDSTSFTAIQEIFCDYCEDCEDSLKYQGLKSVGS